MCATVLAAQVPEDCPEVDNLIFIPVHYHHELSPGNVQAYSKNGIYFRSIVNGQPAPTLAPKARSPLGNIYGVTFRDSYRSGDYVTCLYNYPGFNGVSVNLSMQGESGN